jgi:hypothetical protein
MVVRADADGLEGAGTRLEAEEEGPEDIGPWTKDIGIGVEESAGVGVEDAEVSPSSVTGNPGWPLHCSLTNSPTAGKSAARQVAGRHAFTVSRKYTFT